MIATDLKKILEERETGTAVRSAQTLAWRESVVFDSELSLSADPMDLYKFNTGLWLDPQFLAEFQEKPDALLEKFNLAKDFIPRADLSMILDRQLTEEERNAVTQLMVLARSNGIASQETAESLLVNDGYGLPAIALALVLVVAIALVFIA